LSEASVAYDIIGDIAIIKPIPGLQANVNELAARIVAASKHVRTVLRQLTPISGEYRTRALEWIFGEKKTETVHREHGCQFKVDLAKVYFSPRLLYERIRIAKKVSPKETVINMFAGVGCFSITIAKHSQVSKVFSIDINPEAVRYMFENVYLNKVARQVSTVLGDSKAIMELHLRGKADRVLMPLPGKAITYLDAAMVALKPKPGDVHIYDFVHARKGEDPLQKTLDRITSRLSRFEVSVIRKETRIVRTIGPNWYQTVTDLTLEKLPTKNMHDAWEHRKISVESNNQATLSL